MTSENSKKKPIGIIVFALILIAIIVIVTVFMGIRGFFKIIQTVLVIGFFIGLIFLIAYLFYWLFIKKHRYDVTYVNKQKLIKAGKINAMKNLNDLYLSGDKGHTRVKIGKITGYCRIQILSKQHQYEKDKNGRMKLKTVKRDGQMQAVYDLDKEEQDVFIIQKGGFISKMFGEPLVVRVNPEDHDELVGDVTLKGFSLIPISEYFFLNKDYLDVRKIDYAILKEAERGIMFENLRDMKEIVDKAIALDSRHKKDIEQKNLIDLPGQPEK